MDDNQVNKSNPEPLVPDIVEQNEPQNTNPKGAGRKPIEEDPVLQQEYESIYAMWLVSGNVAAVARAKKVSVGKVKFAVSWMRKNGSFPDKEEFLRDFRARISEKRVKIKSMAYDEEQNGQLLCYPNGDPILKTDGKTPYKRIDKNLILSLYRELRELDKLELALEATSAPLSISNNTVTVEGNLIINKNVTEAAAAMNNGMADEDKQTILKISAKYAKRPSED